MSGHKKNRSSSEDEFLDTLKLSNLDRLAIEDMRRHAAFNRPLGMPTRPSVAETVADPARLARENAELRDRVEQLERSSQTAPAQARQPDTDPDLGPWSANDYENLLQEKSAIIRALQMQIEELQNGAGASPKAMVPADMHTIKEQQAEHVSQFGDTQALIARITQTERAASKDQAEISRLRDEIERLHEELRHYDTFDPRD
jgi:hypothetical protein